MTAKIFRSIMLAVGGVLLASLLIILGCLYDYFANVQLNQLRAELDLAAAGVEQAGTDYLSSLDQNTSRLTWIASDGSVLYDAQADHAAMENHADREEVREALSDGTGYSVRYSDTLFEKTVYCAKTLSDGSVLRISVSRATMTVLVLGMLQPICIVLLIALVVAFLLARRLSRRIVEPLNTLDLDHPLENNAYDELSPLLRRISQQRNQINTQLRQLRQKKDEFTQITDGMNEGLVLLDQKGVILSINPAAQRLFRTGERAVGRDFLTIERTRAISDAIADALANGRHELTLERDDRVYQLDFSRIESAGTAVGVVLLSFDVTEKVDAERTRREFTANVSHELKTPLTAILGSSEMIENELVKPEDLPRFIGHIRNEAARLLQLIEDILRLSQLDEGAALPVECIDLAAVAGEVTEQLRDRAAKNDVTLTLAAEPCPLYGVPRLFREIVTNLAENAVKYNVAGGSVTICVTRDGILTVSDTGIGIPVDQQQRVFERFYRVDKSHSKAIGGTGLGLSIVKHAAAYLHAPITLTSTLGAGTTVRVDFSKSKKEV